MALPDGDADVSGVNIWITLSSDQMTAALSGRVDEGIDRRQVQQAITKLLRDKGLKHGLSASEMRQSIETLCQGQELDKLVIAAGTPPEPGQDAAIDLLVAQTEPQSAGPGTGANVDFRDRGSLPVVEAGTPLAALRPAVPGKPGRNVLGQLVKAPPVRLLRLLSGRGVTVEDGGRVLVASAKGILNHPETEKFEVLDILEIKGDVDFKVGHVNFPGLVKVSGAVLPDFRVRAHSLEVETLETRSRVELAGDLKVMGGIMGAEVVAGGKVQARYVRQSRVTCGGDFLAESEIVSSEIVSNGKVTVVAGEGRIVNSQVAAIQGVTTGDLICSARGATVVRLGVRPEFEQRLMNARRQVASLDKEREHIEEAMLAQEQELEATEDELRGILAALNDPGQQSNRENLLTQVQMIKPLRQALKEGVLGGKERLEEIQYQSQRLGEKIAEMEKVMPVGAVWLDVRGRAEALVEIRGPRASLVLENSEDHFSAREQEMVDKASGTSGFIIKAGRLRASAG
ncbi:MAG: FapA family protein [Pseudomonadota bacterium]